MLQKQLLHFAKTAPLLCYAFALFGALTEAVCLATLLVRAHTDSEEVDCGGGAFWELRYLIFIVGNWTKKLIINFKNSHHFSLQLVSVSKQEGGVSLLTVYPNKKRRSACIWSTFWLHFTSCEKFLRSQMKSLRFGKHWVALNARDSCCWCSSGTVWIVNHWYTQVGIGEQSCKKLIIVSLISPHQKEPWFTPGQRDQERMCLQITASAAQPAKAMLTTHSHHLLWLRHGKSSNTQSQYTVSRIINPLSNYRQFVLSCRLLDTHLRICWLFRMQDRLKMALTMI